MILTPAGTGHLEGLLRLETAFPPKQRWSEQTWIDEFPRPDQRILVTVDEASGAVLGAAVFRRAGDVVDLDRVVVDPGARGRGLARAMVEAGLRWASQQGAERILLEVDENNDAAIRLYRAHGFTEIARRDDYYATGEHALVMELERRAG